MIKDKRIELFRNGALAYLIVVLLLIARYFLVLDLSNGLSMSIWTVYKGVDTRLQYAFFTEGMDYIAHFLFNPLLIPAYDWYYNRTKLDRSFRIYDFLIILCFFVEIFVWSWIQLIKHGDAFGFVSSWQFFVLVAAFVIQMIIFLELRKNGTSSKKGLKMLLVLPALVYGPLLLYGIFVILFIVGYQP